jgi:hypothetical protein
MNYISCAEISGSGICYQYFHVYYAGVSNSQTQTKCILWGGSEVISGFILYNNKIENKSKYQYFKMPESFDCYIHKQRILNWNCTLKYCVVTFPAYFLSCIKFRKEWTSVALNTIIDLHACFLNTVQNNRNWIGSIHKMRKIRSVSVIFKIKGKYLFEYFK